MALKILTQRQVVRVKNYGLNFADKENPGSSYCFDCDADGQLLPFENEAARENYLMCMIDGRYEFPTLVTYEHTYIESTTAECTCGHVIELESFTNTCANCYTDYNSSGQRLAPRSQWGEETGESVTDILNIGHTVS